MRSLRAAAAEGTEKGEMGDSHFVGTNCCLPSDAKSAALLDFVAVVDVTDRRRASLMRTSNSSFPLVQLENPLSYAVKDIKGPSQQANGSHGVYAEGLGFCLSAERPKFLFVAW